jgi:hypothetical protein
MLVSDMETVAALEPQSPIIIYRSVNRDGQTFALEPSSRARLRAEFGDSVHLHPRIFIAHETKADQQKLRSDLAEQVIQLLTGVPASRLQALGGVSFRDDSDLPLGM